MLRLVSCRCHVSIWLQLTLPCLANPCSRVISKNPMTGNMMAVKALMGSQYSCRSRNHVSAAQTTWWCMYFGGRQHSNGFSYGNRCTGCQRSINSSPKKVCDHTEQHRVKTNLVLMLMTRHAEKHMKIQLTSQSASVQRIHKCGTSTLHGLHVRVLKGILIEQYIDWLIKCVSVCTFSPCKYHAGVTPKSSWPRMPTTAIIAHRPLVFSPSANLQNSHAIRSTYGSGITAAAEAIVFTYGKQ